MVNEFNLVKLKDITSKITKGTTPSKSDGGFSNSGVNYIKAESVSYDGRIDESKFAYISENVHEKLKRSQLKENDILFSMAGAFLGKTGYVMSHHLPANTNQALALIRVLPEIAHPKFIHFYLQQKKVVHFVNNAVSQSAQPNINLQQIGDLDIYLLPMSKQRLVVNHLESIDNKIALNRQINQTLEQMAQTLFKSWFVDFDPVMDNALDVGNPIPDALQHRAEVRKAVRESEGFKPLPDD
ncbi:restriction endonuclease subunit S, partial [Vibrio diabolicus]|uniref:restriction endonuclease subunit S n=1 Tax=Vibrio diabolicus TaxID=50719 RepID=UPI00215F3A5A